MIAIIMISIIPQISENSNIFAIICIFTNQYCFSYMEFFTTAGGITVHVWDTKKGEKTLLLLHGYLETMYIFSELIEALRDNYRIITLDLPGHGLSESAPAGRDGQRVNSVQFDVPVIASVMEKCGVGKAVICGHSMGGFVALECLKERPELFEKAVLLNSHPFADLPEKAPDRKREMDVIRAEKISLLASASIPKMYAEANLRRCDEKVMETVELCETHNPEGIIASIRGLMSRPDLGEVMEKPPVPLMLVYGDCDNFLPLERVEEMKKLYKEVKFTLIPSTGHNSFIEDMPKVVDALTLFC